MQIAVRAILCVILAATMGVADVPAFLQRSAGLISMYPYQPRMATSLEDVPEPARGRLEAHLKQRLGEAFYSRLEVSGGQIVDFEEFHRAKPTWRNYKWEVFAYRLHFRFSLPEKGIEYYEAAISLRSDGSVIDEIELPKIAKYPERGEFVALASAIKTATAFGFDVARCDVRIEYRREEDRCVYLFRQLIREEGVRLTYRCLDVDAHTGKKIRTSQEEAIR
jgi:hypothetical protein